MKKKGLIVILSFFILFVGSASKKVDLRQVEKTVKSVSSSIRYGVGAKEAMFNDEIIKTGVGNCGHYAIMLFRKLMSLGYDVEIVSLETYNHRAHTLVQITSGETGKKIVADATTGLLYSHGVTEIVSNPELSREHIGKSRYPRYSDIDFWESIKSLRYFPYPAISMLDNIESLSLKNQRIFYETPHDIGALNDHNYDTYAATKEQAADQVTFVVTFKKRSRLSSIVIEPYSNELYPKHVAVACLDTDQMIFDDDIRLKRSLVVINIVDPAKQQCRRLRFSLSHFQGQNRLLIRDIYFLGKETEQ